MGAPKSPAEHQNFEPARFGFALASNVLLMREGLRRVTVTLRFDGCELQQRLDSLDQKIQKKQNFQKNNEVNKNQTELEDIFLKVFRKLFVIELTGPAGWLAVDDYHPSSLPQQQNNEKKLEKTTTAQTTTVLPQPAPSYTLVLEFDLPQEASAVVPYTQALHGEAFQVQVPVMRLLLNPTAYVYPYGLLRGLPLASATIEVDVAGCRQLSLTNQSGMLSPIAPFQPFGPLPVVGCYLIVGCGEAAGKVLTGFDVALEWGNLPADNGGFHSYYHDYPNSVATGDYVARVEALTDGVWGQDEGAAGLLPLFRTNCAVNASKRVLKSVQLSCASMIDRLKPATPQAQAAAAPYSAGSCNGFFKFTLAGPQFAFGHRDYPQALAYALQHNVHAKSRRFPSGVPELPYTPLVNAISVNYRALARVDLYQNGVAPADGWNDTLFYLHP